MRFTAKTEEELNQDRLLPEGDYPFQISGSTEKLSKKGNEMIQLLVRVFKPDGEFVLVNDYLMEVMQFKLLHCCQVCGLEKEYESGELEDQMFIGKQGMLKLSIRPEGDFPAQNQIKDYIVQKDRAPKVELPKNDDLGEDEIPFS